MSYTTNIFQGTSHTKKRDKRQIAKLYAQVNLKGSSAILVSPLTHGVLG